jgi:hypothetical protein
MAPQGTAAYLPSMTLSQDGEPTQTPGGPMVLAKDHEVRRVVVVTTDEAVQDYGWATIWQVASDKYDRGETSMASHHGSA